MDVLRFLRPLSLFAAIVILQVLGAATSQKMHEWGRTNRVVHDVVLAVDLVDFAHTGGGFFGASHNYFGWQYAKAMANPDRALWHKLLFWPNPFYVTQPPDKWPYDYQGG